MEGVGEESDGVVDIRIRSSSDNSANLEKRKGGRKKEERQKQMSRLFDVLMSERPEPVVIVLF